MRLKVRSKGWQEQEEPWGLMGCRAGVQVGHSKRHVV